MKLKVQQKIVSLVSSHKSVDKIKKGAGLYVVRIDSTIPPSTDTKDLLLL
jgi:ribosomal protein L24E